MSDESKGRNFPGDHQTVESHNAWVDEGRFDWCRPCDEQTGLKRVMGWTPIWAWSDQHQAAFPTHAGTRTCPVCKNTETVKGPPGTRFEDPPDPIHDRVAP